MAKFQNHTSLPSDRRPIAANVDTGGARTPGAPDFERQLEFLYKSLEDNQNVIRFLDAKAGFAIVLLSAMAGKIMSNMSSYLPRAGLPLWHVVLLCVFLTSLLLAALIFVRVIFPSSNPAANCRTLTLTPPFFLCEFKPKRFHRIFTSNPKYSQLAQDHEAYLGQILTADATALVRVISAEVLKVSYIRQIKADRLRGLAHASGVCVLLFAALILADAIAPKASKHQLIQVQRPVVLQSQAASAALTLPKTNGSSAPPSSKAVSKDGTTRAQY